MMTIQMEMKDQNDRDWVMMMITRIFLNSSLEIVTQFISTTVTPPRLSPRHKTDYNNENGSDASVVLASKIIHHSYILMQSIKVL